MILFRQPCFFLCPHTVLLNAIGPGRWMMISITIKTLILAFAVILAVIILDSTLPTNKMETRVSSIDTSNGRLTYVIPLTAGDVDKCSADKNVMAALSRNSQVVIEKTALFERCNASLPSWPVDVDKFVQRAVRRTSADNYANIEALRIDYPGFTPHIRLWGDDPWYLSARLRRYSVQMPEEVVIFDPDGNVTTTRTCGTVGGYCKIVSPIHPERAIVGTVQYGEPDYAMATGFELEWPGHPDAIFVKSGHCFSVYSQSGNVDDLIVRPTGAGAMRVSTGFGFYLVAGKGSGFSAFKTSRAVFEKSRSCISEARAAWPNIGGVAWKR